VNGNIPGLSFDPPENTRQGQRKREGRIWTHDAIQLNPQVSGVITICFRA
jgi:hypothetical protein